MTILTGDAVSDEELEEADMLFSVEETHRN